MDPLRILQKHIDPNSDLYPLLVAHSEAVRDKALAVGKASGLPLDLDFVAEAAMLHDIGVASCDAPGIHCHGSLPYICHGLEGGRILRAEGLPRHARVCESHTGSGLTVAEIEAQNLPLPRRDMCPETLEEKLICYADKFFSKSGDPRREKPLERVRASLASFGPDSLARFDALHRLFVQND